MTTANQPERASPPQPVHPLSAYQFLRVARTNWLAACDEQLFAELFVERRFLWRRFFVISDPDGIRRVMQDNVDNYPRLNLMRRNFEFDSGTGMLCAEGPVWRRHRSLINPTLDHRATLPDVPMLIALAEELAWHLGQLAPDHEIDISQALGHLITASMRHVLTTEDREIEPMLRRMARFPSGSSFTQLLPIPRWLPFFNRYRTGYAETESFRPMLDRLIAERRSPDYMGRRDLLWRLAHARDRHSGEGLSAAELRDETITLGQTSSTSLRPLPWLWYLLATHPGVEDRLHAELDEILRGRPPSLDDLPNLVYVRKLLEEAMRLYPPVPVMMLRRAVADDVVCGHRIARNSIVVIMPWVLHRHRKLWQDPDRFDPERFSPEQVAARSRYSYLPFSIGPHVCVGASLAMTQMVIAVAVLAQRFRFRLVPGQQVEPKAWINLHPGRGIKMTVEPRVAAALG
jgi:cytochrome P450